MARPKVIPTVVISKSDAVSRGLRHYFTDVPCKNGHRSVRGILNGACLECVSAAVIKMRAADPAIVARKARQPKPETTEGIVTRVDAQRLGMPRYFTGIRCKNGHLSERMTHGRQCLACHRERRTAVRSTQGAKVKAQKAASYLRHRDRVIAHVVGYTTANSSKVRVRRRKHREANKPRLAATNAEWRSKNRHISRQHEHNRRAREAGAEGTHTANEISDMMEAQEFVCVAPGCATSLREMYHVDHIMPLSKGGSNWITNIQLLCPFHNQSKHAMDPDEWVQSLVDLR